MNRNNIELLAPAGTYDSLVAAIQSGADAVYLGGKNFGARSYAGNFDNDEIVEAVKYAHIRDKKVYVVVNTLIKDDEILDCLNFIDFLYKNDVDALILQDIGLSNIIKDKFPDFELHSSTQMSVANVNDVSYLQKNGFKRVVLARENSLEDINYIKNKTGIDIETFVHGALCVSYSGKCLFSYMSGGRSSNRGDCAQPCRKKYYTTIFDSKDSNYFLSTKDLSTIEYIKDLIKNGVDSFKIEGRMKRPEYVATVVKSYREVIDSIIYSRDIDIEKIKSNLENSFNRGFVKGLVLNELPKNLVNLSNSKSIGINIGSIIEKRKNKIKIKLENDINKGDGLSLGENVGRILVNGNVVEKAVKGDEIELDYIGNAKVGDIVRKTSDKKLSDSISEMLKNENVKIPISMFVDIKKNENPKIDVLDNNGYYVSYIEESEIVEESSKLPLTKDNVREQLLKLNDTIYQLKNIEINMDDNSFLKKSTLNSLRRNVVKILDEKRMNINNRKIENIYFNDINDIYNLKSIDNKNDISLSVKCFSKNQLNVCKDMGIEDVYVDDIDNYLYAKKIGLNSFFSTPIVMKDHQINEILKFIEEEKPKIISNSIGFLDYIYSNYNYKNKSLRIDYLSNIYNKFSIEKFCSNRYIDYINLSLEHDFLNTMDKKLISGYEDKIEIPIYIHPILMFTEYCPQKTNIKCKKCFIDNKKIISEDNQNSAILKKDIFCRMQLISVEAFDYLKKIKDFKKLGIRKFRIDLLNETENDTKNILKKCLGICYE